MRGGHAGPWRLRRTAPSLPPLSAPEDGDGPAPAATTELPPAAETELIPEVAEDPRVTAALEEIQARVAAEQDTPLAAMLTAPARQRPFLDVRGDLDALPLFRDTVRVHMVRQEAARGHRAPDGTWQGQYARIWHERTRFPVPPLPDYGLHRYDGIAGEIVAHAMAAVEVERAAARPVAMGPEQTGRHAAGNEVAS